MINRIIPASTVFLLVVFDIDFRLLPFASRDVALEHDVNLAIGSTLHLRQAKVRDDQTKQSRTAPDVAALASNCTVSAKAKIFYAKNTYDFRQWGSACTRRLFFVSLLTQVSVKMKAYGRYKEFRQCNM